MGGGGEGAQIFYGPAELNVLIAFSLPVQKFVNGKQS